MENVLLVIHLILALCLIGVVLLQRSEGGGLGMGGGGGGAMTTGRAAATALGKLTWLFAIAFILTSITLTVLAAQRTGSGSVVDRVGVDAPFTPPVAAPSGQDLLPPPAPEGGALLPPRVD
ncbi:MAG: preprotein translocase subunit SecG [Paracoccaceae bacterium]